jgi:hypothetical protein
MFSAYWRVLIKLLSIELLCRGGKRIVFLSASRYCAIYIIQEGQYGFI